MSDRKRVLITGAAGKIADVLRSSLAGEYELSGVDRVPVPGFDSAVADLTDLESVRPTFRNKDVVLHLAAEPRHTPDIGWPLLMPDNVVATANTFEAARQGGAGRVIFFSSMHVNGLYERDHPLGHSPGRLRGTGLVPDEVPLVTHEMPVRPDGPYAVSKSGIWGTRSREKPRSP